MMMRCIECDAIVTGVVSPRGDGFARCPAHSRKLAISLGADPVAPRVGLKSLTYQRHREAMAHSLLGRSVEKYIRESEGFVNNEIYGTWVWTRGREAVECWPASTSCCTVKRLDIFGEVHDTHQTEAELNGWRESQGALL